MKRIVLFLFVFTRTISANAQPYQSLFGSNSTAWKIVLSNLDILTTDSVRTGGDTLVDARNYKKIFSNYACCNGLAGFLRDDSSSGKAWFYSLGDSVEKLIMNLSLTVGDSIHSADLWPDTGWVLVDSVYYNSGRKYVRLNTTVNQYGWGGWGEKLVYIEGIGTNRGIQDLNVTNNDGPYLLCSYKDLQSIYLNNNPNFNQCYLLTSTYDYEHFNMIAKIMPNPITLVSVLIFSNPNHLTYFLDIYDFVGRRVKRWSTTSNFFEIKREDYKEGIFLYNLHDIYNKDSIKTNSFFIKNEPYKYVN